ncbi:hypothetical protein DPEC_G00337000 [Dallia pectoralis]|uniref:Uncharacterized protein n=1 Tax=Dallia pectoralis TaxID=75939 RepID=A0ACC2F7F5_DALPE|nr:hypothetical protein DPEC_G00337000 [Dallia pectoralis]
MQFKVTEVLRRFKDGAHPTYLRPGRKNDHLFVSHLITGGTVDPGGTLEAAEFRPRRRLSNLSVERSPRTGSPQTGSPQTGSPQTGSPQTGSPRTDMEEWRQCGRWLIDCKVLPPSHRVVWPSAAVFDLAQALRDGVLMCQMLHNLSPGSVDLKEINFRPQMSQFLCLKNIRTFLKVCHDKFGLRNSELFDPFDLFDVRDFGKVIAPPDPPFISARSVHHDFFSDEKRYSSKPEGDGTAGKAPSQTASPDFYRLISFS